MDVQDAAQDVAVAALVVIKGKNMNRTKKSLINDIKILRSKRKTLKEFAEEKFLDKDGNAVINVYVSKENLFSSFSKPGEPELSNDFFEYIEEQANFIPVEYPISVVVHTEEDVDASYIEKKFREHYYIQLIDKEDDLKRNKITSILLFSLGLILLSVYFTLTLVPNVNILFNEVFSIAGSFSIWEAVDYFLINRNAIKIQYYNIAQLSLSKISISNYVKR